MKIISSQFIVNIDSNPNNMFDDTPGAELLELFIKILSPTLAIVQKVQCKPCTH